LPDCVRSFAADTAGESRLNLKFPNAAHAIINGFGRTLGDSIMGLQALAAAQQLGREGRPVLFRLPGLPAMVQALYSAAADMADVVELPWADETPARPFAGAQGFGRVTDIRDFAFDPAFRGVAMIDYFLTALGLAPHDVPVALKRNAWLASRVTPEISGRGYVLVCPNTSSPMRTMPDAVHSRILAFFAGRVEVHSQARLRPAERLEELCGLVAAAQLVVSADTAMVHLADAFAVPCLAFFTTHHPEWRVRDYPLCRPVHLPAGLPEEAIEFPRDKADVAACQAAWFAPGADLAWLDLLLERAFDWSGATR
jgi:hypothetical protein